MVYRKVNIPLPCYPMGMRFPGELLDKVGIYINSFTISKRINENNTINKKLLASLGLFYSELNFKF